jgi:hypothetical protein
MNAYEYFEEIKKSVNTALTQLIEYGYAWLFHIKVVFWRIQFFV